MKLPLFLIIRAALVFATLGLAPALTANGPGPIRLYEIGVVKFITVDGQPRLQQGQLNALGAFRLASDNPTATQVPASLQGKPLIYTETWHAFQTLGPDAVANFELLSEPIVIGGLIHYEVGPREDALLTVGELSALSTRGLVSADQPLIAGFVIDAEHRRILLRAVGPSLTQHGVTGALADPYLTIYEGNLALYFNDDWGTRDNAAEIVQVSAHVGVTPFSAGSKESALLVELEPGIYTAHVAPANGAGGVALVEIYRVPN